MLTVKQEDAQDFCVSVCQLKLGKGETSGHYIDLDAGQGAPDWWFYENEDGELWCYPVSADEVAASLADPECSYTVLEI